MAPSRTCPACARAGAQRPSEGCAECRAETLSIPSGAGVRGAALLAALMGGVSACAGGATAAPGEAVVASAPAAEAAAETPAEDARPTPEARPAEGPQADAVRQVMEGSTDEARRVEEPLAAPAPPPDSTVASGPGEAVAGRAIAAYGGPPDRELAQPSPTMQITEQSLHVEADGGATPPDSRDVQRMLRRQGAVLQGAFLQGLRSAGAPTQTGRLEVVLEIDANGRVQDVEVVLSGFGNDAFEERVHAPVEQSFQRLRFQPASDGSAYRVRWSATVDPPDGTSSQPAPRPPAPPRDQPIPPDERPPQVDGPERQPVPVYGGPPSPRRRR